MVRHLVSLVLVSSLAAPFAFAQRDLSLGAVEAVRLRTRSLTLAGGTRVRMSLPRGARRASDEEAGEGNVRFEMDNVVLTLEDHPRRTDPEELLANLGPGPRGSDEDERGTWLWDVDRLAAIASVRLIYLRKLGEDRVLCRATYGTSRRAWESMGSSAPTRFAAWARGLCESIERVD